MKLSLCLLAVATVVTASPAADVFILDPSVPNTDAPQLSREVARLILAHRLSDIPDEDAPLIPDSISSSQLDDHINAYGKPRQSLFAAQRAGREPQLVVLVEGAAADNMKAVRDALATTNPAFSVPEPPSSAANSQLLSTDFSQFTGSWEGSESCPLHLALNRHEERCWTGDSLVVKYDAEKDPETIDLLASSIPKLLKWSNSGELETTLVILPESSRGGSINAWAEANTHTLGRREQKETVMEFNTKASDSPEASSAPVTPNSPVVALASGTCFTTYAKCMNTTFGCFKHGNCTNAGAGDTSCFQCACEGTTDKWGVVTEWAGEMCQKVDVSTEFWMFVGVGLLTFLAVGGGLTMLVSVGNEPLPGVLGAGVVKTK